MLAYRSPIKVITARGAALTLVIAAGMHRPAAIGVGYVYSIYIYIYIYILYNFYYYLKKFCS